MIRLKGIHLEADETSKLHEFARKVGLSKSWFHLFPKPHYDVICPFVTQRILNNLKNKTYEIKGLAK